MRKTLHQTKSDIAFKEKPYTKSQQEEIKRFLGFIHSVAEEQGNYYVD